MLRLTFGSHLLHRHRHCLALVVRCVDDELAVGESLAAKARENVRAALQKRHNNVAAAPHLRHFVGQAAGVGQHRLRWLAAPLANSVEQPLPRKRVFELALAQQLVDRRRAQQLLQRAARRVQANQRVVGVDAVRLEILRAQQRRTPPRSSFTFGSRLSASNGEYCSRSGINNIDKRVFPHPQCDKAPQRDRELRRTLTAQRSTSFSSHC